MMFRSGVALFMTALIGLWSAPAGAALSQVGPVNPGNGYPLWYMDSNGLALSLCLVGDGVTGPCPFDPVDPFFPFSAQTGFGAEAFYTLAVSTINTRQVNGDLIIALEAAYAPGDPVNGDQVTFARVRFRAGNLPVDGTYTLVHPFGTQTFDVVLGAAPRAVRQINYTQDIGIGGHLDFTGALKGAIGPFLKPTVGFPFVDPATGITFIANPALRHAVTGSPFGTNFFRIIGPAGVDITGEEVRVPGTGSDTVTEPLFTLVGQVATRLGVGADRVVYSRGADGTGFVDVFAQSGPRQQIQVSGAGIAATAMGEEAGTGRYFLRVPFDGVTLPLPATVTVTNISDTPDFVVTRPVVDDVSVTEATFDTGTGTGPGTLRIVAASSDLAAPPVLTAVGLGNLAGGVLALPGVLAPPARVTVTSSAGGVDPAEPVSGSGPALP